MYISLITMYVYQTDGMTQLRSQSFDLGPHCWTPRCDDMYIHLLPYHPSMRYPQPTCNTMPLCLCIQCMRVRCVLSVQGCVHGHFGHPPVCVCTTSNSLWRYIFSESTHTYICVSVPYATWLHCSSNEICALLKLKWSTMCTRVFPPLSQPLHPLPPSH